MSEDHVSIVDIDATSDSAPALGERLRTWLVENGIVRQSDAPTFQKIELEPGPSFSAVLDAADAGVVPGSVEISVGRRVYDTGGNGVELSCSQCRAHFEPDDRWFDRVGTWFEGDDAVAYPCPACGFEQRLAEWEGPFAMGFGNVGLTFSDCPPPSDAFLERVKQLLGHRVRIVLRHI
ncbi:MAG: hypothetical protein HY898_21275 [Deltaproteobacteria bacterium]|nr:hypothetical protein [Deltaproteobacteria bacterium]